MLSLVGDEFLPLSLFLRLVLQNSYSSPPTEEDHHTNDEHKQSNCDKHEGEPCPGLRIKALRMHILVVLLELTEFMV